MSICLLDTTVFVEILDVPNLNDHRAELVLLLKQKIKDRESLLLPLATILETGNHIAQNGDGGQKRKTAVRFVEQVSLALDGASPFEPILFHDHGDIAKWLENFPDYAMGSKSLGDLSIIQDWERMCAIAKKRRVYIWSLDEHLASYDRG